MKNRTMDKGVVRDRRGYAANEVIVKQAFERSHHANGTESVDNKDLCNGDIRDSGDSTYNREHTYNKRDTYKKDDKNNPNGAIQTDASGSFSWTLRSERILGSGCTVGLAIVIIVLLLAGCLSRGLYYSADLYPVILIAAGSILIMIVLFLVGIRLEKEQEQEQEQGRKQVPLSPVHWLGNNERMGWRMIRIQGILRVLWPLGMMTCFGVHAWAGSVSKQGSMDEMLRWSLLGMFTLLTAILAARTNGARWLACGWQMAGGLLVLSGIFAVCGILPLPFGVMRTADPEISSAGARLGGLLQYPNAYGAVVGMYALERLTAAARVIARPVPAGRLIAAVLPLMPAQAALLLSESRGAWLATGCAAVAAFALQRRGARLPLLLAMAAPLACAAWLYRQLAAAQLAPAPVPGLLAMAGAWAAALLGTLLLCRLWHSGAAKAPRAAALTAIVLAGAAAALMAVASTADRLAAGVGTGVSRLEMWRDALQLWTEAAWLGHGGDTWRNMFRAIQSSPYVGGEVHNGLLDLALDTGMIGILLVAGWFLLTLRSIFHFAPQLMPSVLVFGLHGAMDFDWSFTLFWMLFIWIGAWAVALKTETEGVQRSGATVKYTPIRSKSGSKLRSKFGSLFLRYFPTQSRPLSFPMRSFFQIFQRVTARLIRVSTVMIILFWIGGTVWLTSRYAVAEVQYRQAMSEPDGTPAQKVHLMVALQSNPNRSDIVISLARTLLGREAESLLLNSLSHSPMHPQIYIELGRLAAQFGEGQQAGEYFEQAIALNRYDGISQSTALYWMEQAARREWKAGYRDRARQTAAAGVQMYERYQLLAEEVEGGDVRNDRRFVMEKHAPGYGENLRRLASASSPPFTPELTKRRP
ncbi:tetratricopeptide (TPR) repeat protein [Paenibacillus xylanexedens]|uniref:O-antigen ligase family protein n=1 Tax=Paenibacillus xylanexedens TaxID=528191 RepID=UPI0020A14C28|nr:O-antigen ligase family protein [Paenibacillus xylanexedens]MCP1423031.1 tetratricopeptide (TPR) repeat protein [Paenibacillus xylanexedens]